jgi:hypothetical protein
MASGDFDTISHVHVMLSEPRSGVFDAIAISSGDVTPEPWVPNDCASYMTLNFDVLKSYDAIGKVVNVIAGENAFQNAVQRSINERIEVDFQKDILEACEGRFTLLTRIEKPASINNHAFLVGAKLKDSKEFQKLVDRMTEKYKDNIEKGGFAGTTFWKIKIPEPAPQAEDTPQAELTREERERRFRARFELRGPQPCFTMLGDYLVYCDRISGMEHAIKTMNDPSKSLAKDLEFKLIMGKIKRQPGGDTPGMITFSRPEEAMRLLYELAQGEQAKTLLAGQAERNDFFKNVDKAMKDHPLPPFSVIQKFLAPGGGLLTSDETGIHYAAFQLRRK